MIISIYLLIVFQCCCGIKYTGLNKFKYSFTKCVNKKNEELNNNPVYLLLTHKNVGNSTDSSRSSEMSIAPNDVSIVNNNNYNDVLSSLKSRVFTKSPTVINFEDELNLGDKSRTVNNKVDESILKLSEIMILLDRVIIPIDYSELNKKGCSGLNELKLMGLLTHSIKLHTQNLPKIHFVIYNYKPLGSNFYLNKYQKEYIERNKYEINDTITEFLNSFASMPDDANNSGSTLDGVNVDCTYVNKYNDMKELLKKMYNEDHNYYKTCMKDIDDEFNKKLKVCENIDKCYEETGRLKKTTFDVEEFNELEKNIELYQEFLNIYKSSYNRFLNGFKALIGDGLQVDHLKSRIDQLVYNTLVYYETSVKQATHNSGQLADKMGSQMKVRLFNNIRSDLYKLNHELINKLLNQFIKNFQEDIKKLNVKETVEEDLSGLISKYDSKYCEIINRIKYEVMKNYKVYDGLTHSLRMELVWELKEYSNKIMVELTKMGKYYYRFSIVDGIRLLPSNKIIRIVKSILSKINMPLNIRICYLSPKAFGFSNLFTSEKELGPSRCFYFTGNKEENEK